VNGEQALIMTNYNFKRVMNILKFDDLLEKLKNSQPDCDADGSLIDPSRI
jgi:hypothetical protein